jgi:cell wall-associated NlpC family hydrolase
MTKSRNFLYFGIFAFISLVILFLAFETSEKLEVLDSKYELVDQEIPMASFQTSESLKDSIVNFGMELLGTPYVAAGSGKDGFDCSGFVYYVFQHFKIKVPRSSADFEHFGIEIPIANVQKGDLLLFLSPTRNVIGHIGIVSNAKGKESDFIHASSGRAMKVVITSLATEGYTLRFVKAIRVF